MIFSEISFFCKNRFFPFGFPLLTFLISGMISEVCLASSISTGLSAPSCESLFKNKEIPTFKEFHPQVTYSPKIPVLSQDLSWELSKQFKRITDVMILKKTHTWGYKLTEYLQKILSKELSHDQVIAISSAIVDLSFQSFIPL